MVKRDVTGFAELQSEAFGSWCRRRDYRALLRSVGHKFRDGRWDESDPGFHVYRETEFPSFGPHLTFQCHPSYLKVGAGDPFGLETVPCNWKPALSRSVESTFFDSSIYRLLPPVQEHDYEDYVLNLNAQGTDFIAKNRPGNPLAQSFQYLVELRQLPQVPRFLHRQAKRFSDLGGEYLNVEFGWKPFIQDLKKIHDLQFKYAHVLNKLVQNNGIPIRRRSKKVVSTDSLVLLEGTFTRPFGDLSDSSSGGNPLLDGYILCGPFGGLAFSPEWTGQAVYRLSFTTYETVWSCGTFKYYVPDIGSNRWTENAIKVLYGANPTPSAIYSVIPWTWLIDWFANVGDIVSNLSANAVDNESLTNAYAMYTLSEYTVLDVSSHWDEIDASSLPGTCFYVPPGEASFSHTLFRGSKFRRQASPFGFGLKRSDFTARQWAILAALAVSRSKSVASWKRRGIDRDYLSE